MSQLDWKAEYACTAGMQPFIGVHPQPRLARRRAGTELAAHLGQEHSWFVDLADVPAHSVVMEAKWECPGITPVT